MYYMLIIENDSDNRNRFLLSNLQAGSPYFYGSKKIIGIMVLRIDVRKLISTFQRNAILSRRIMRD